MKYKIKLMPDYCCYPLWWTAESGKAGDINPISLPLKPDTIKRLMDWSDQYDHIFNQQDPSASGFKNDADEIAFDQQGIQLWYQLREELKDDYEVYYFSQRLHKHLTNPQELATVLGSLDKVG